MPQEHMEGRGPGGPGPRQDRGFHPRPVNIQPHTAITVQENGDVLLKFKAKPGAEVVASVGNDFHNAIRLPMVDKENVGLFTAVLPKPELEGPQRIMFQVNGFDVVNMAGPMWYCANSLQNYVELPDPETDALIEARRDVPHGAVTHEFYYSEAFGRFLSSVVYTPPGYEDGEDYPVLYFFHECAENETAWTDASRLNFLLDNLIAQGKCKPFLVVENDCTVRLDYHEQEDWFENYDKIERFLLEDCPRYIEGKYKVRRDKWGRAIAGIGLGAVQAGYIGMRNTQFFGNLGLFTAFWISTAFHAQGKDDPFYTAAEYIGQHPEEVKVFFRSEGDADIHFNGIQSENELLAALGVDKLPGYVFRVYHQNHNWGSYRRSFRDFAPLLFRD